MTLKINYKGICFYTLYAIGLILLNKTIDGVPLALGLYFAFLLCGTHIAITPILYCISSIVNLNLITSALSIFESGFLCLIVFFYRRANRKINLEGLLYLIISLAPYVAFSPLKTLNNLAFIKNEYVLRGIAAAGVVIFSYFAYKCIYSLIFKVLRCKLKEEEYICCAILYSAIGVGLYNLAGLFSYAVFAVSALIFFARLSKSPSSIICSLVLAIPACIISLSPLPFAFYALGATIILIFVNTGRLIPSIVGLTLSCAYLYFLGEFNETTPLIVVRCLLILCACTLPAIPSDKRLEKLKYRLLVKDILPDTAIFRNRRNVGEKLYRISEVFREIECAFNTLDEDLNDSSLRARMLEELQEKCCKNCERVKRCVRSEVYLGFKKIIDNGCAKGKVSLIDLTSEITSNCTDPTNLIAKLNLLLSEYRRAMTESENAKSGRILLADQAHGVTEVMKNCAVELCKSYNEYTGLEENIKNKLANIGISCPELYICGDDLEISAVICGKFEVNKMLEIFFECVKKKYELKDKLVYDGEKCCLIFGAPPKFDAAFGVAYAIKKGEKVSGDTHSVIRINEHSFLMALSDGMGSGEYAKKVSSTAISLIEAFYRAEMPEGTVLKTINKLLSFNRDERFTCIDIGAVNLNTGVANFVKIGSPIGMIIRENEIKILESNSLPLGILENLRPSVCSEQLKNGDIVVFMSDGITSSFSSHTELYEFIQGLKPLNPQNLADKILEGAKLQANGIADDMTVLCTRIFER